MIKSGDVHPTNQVAAVKIIIVVLLISRFFM